MARHAGRATVTGRPWPGGASPSASSATTSPSRPDEARSRHARQLRGPAPPEERHPDLGILPGRRPPLATLNAKDLAAASVLSLRKFVGEVVDGCKQQVLQAEPSRQVLAPPSASITAAGVPRRDRVPCSDLASLRNVCRKLPDLGS
jgi:hypothetical protein